MPSKLLVAFLLGLSVSLANAQTKFALTGQGVPEGSTILDVGYSGPDPTPGSPYLSPTNWKPRWKSSPDSPSVAVSVEGVSLVVHQIQLHLSGSLPPDLFAVSWTVLFNPPDASPELPQVVPIPASDGQPSKPVAKDCNGNGPHPFLCPPAAKQAPDLSLSGSFLAAGGTKPIYGLSAKGNLLFTTSPNVAKELHNFNPGIAADVEINQSEQPPANRTRFDPDSITAGLSFTRIVPVTNPRLYGIEFQFGLPAGEFSRKDPSSNIIVSGTSKFGLKPWQSSKNKFLYATLYPLLGFEVGHNLDKPSQVSGVLVNFTNYNGIFRGLAGGDAKVAVKAKDLKSDVFAISGSYRVRLPALDEPFVNAVHPPAVVALTTKARNWVEANLTYAPWSFKYLSISAKYQYGSLPPLFNLVDNKFTLGLMLQAVQSGKPNIGQ